MPRLVQVQSLRLEAASGTTLYPGENGFSVAWGEVEADEPKLVSALDAIVADGASVTLRCGLLEVAGKLRHHQGDGSQHL